MAFRYDYPRPGVTADAVVFSIHDERLSVLLVRRRFEPWKGRWALPGGFVEPNEPLRRAAARELEEETGLAGVPLRLLSAAGADRRDPRGWCVGVFYWGLVRAERVRPAAADDAEDAAFRPARSARALAFDHDRHLSAGIATLEVAARRGPFGRELLPARFTMDALRRVYEIVLGQPIAGDALRRFLQRHEVVRRDGRRDGRACWRWNARAYRAWSTRGWTWTLEA